MSGYADIYTKETKAVQKAVAERFVHEAYWVDKTTVDPGCDWIELPTKRVPAPGRGGVFYLTRGEALELDFKRMVAQVFRSIGKGLRQTNRGGPGMKRGDSLT